MKTSSLVCVYLLSTKDNYQFLKGMRNLVTKSGYKLKICHEYMNRGDRWMQVGKLNLSHFNFSFTCRQQSVDACFTFKSVLFMGKYI